MRVPQVCVEPTLDGACIRDLGRLGYWGSAGGAFALGPGTCQAAVVRPTTRPGRGRLERGSGGFEGGDTPGGESVVCVFVILLTCGDV